MSISVAVITCGPSDLLALLQKSPALTVEVLHPNALTPHCLDGFQCACVLGGTREEPLVFPAECRSVVEDFSHSGRRVSSASSRTRSLNRSHESSRLA